MKIFRTSPLCVSGSRRTPRIEIANGIEAIQGVIHIEKINRPVLFRDNGTPAEYVARLQRAIDNGAQLKNRDQAE